MVKEIPMTDDSTPDTGADADPIAADSTPVAASTPSAAAEPAPSAPKAARTNRKPTAGKKAATNDDAAKQTCAACGATAVFTEHSVVGGVVPLDYHDCELAAQLVHDFVVTYASDQQATPPVLATAK